jgi:hypothetical protein
MPSRKKKATPKPRVRATKKVRTVRNVEHTQLEVYAIWLNEYYKSLVSAGFSDEMALALMMDKESYPAWVNFEIPKTKDANNFLDEEDED